MDAVPFGSVLQHHHSRITDGETIVEREPPSKLFVQIVMSVAALLHLGIACAIWFVEDTPLHQLSSVIFLLSAGGCAHVAWRMENIKVVAWAGSITLVAYASRAALILYSFMYSQLEVSDARAWLIMFNWTLLTLYAYTIFVRGLAPLSRLHRIRHLAREDG